MATGDEFGDDIFESIDNNTSDYGSDLDEEAWESVFSQSQIVAPVATDTQEDNILEPVLPDDDVEPPPRSIRLARIRQNLEKAISGLENTAAEMSREVDIKYDKGGLRSDSQAIQLEREPSPIPAPAVEPPACSTDTDAGAPITRFRRRKPLSVTDLVAPAWCELQYWYSLTKYGKIRRTPAMKAGTKIHKEKEREVYTEVPIEIATKEDKFGLRLWNIIQGLRTLRAIGLTRELEVMGIVEGEVIIGIIDEVSYKCPDEVMEQGIMEAVEEAKTAGKNSKKKGKEVFPADQRTMTDFLPSTSRNAISSQSSWASPSQIRTLYLTDIKTRKAKDMPKLGSQMRATQMQLMMYSRLLNDLAANNVDATRVFERYDVDAYTNFSDGFIAQLASLDLSSSSNGAMEELNNAEDEPGLSTSDPHHDPLDEILAYNNLSSLWMHMISEYTRTISVTPASSSISPMLTAEFRSSDHGRFVGRRCFAFEQNILDDYVASVMRWWRGDREAVGVEIEEVYKCRSCDFLENCGWRKSKAEEAVLNARARNSQGGSLSKARTSI